MLFSGCKLPRAGVLTFLGVVLELAIVSPAGRGAHALSGAWTLPGGDLQGHARPSARQSTRETLAGFWPLEVRSHVEKRFRKLLLAGAGAPRFGEVWPS